MLLALAPAKANLATCAPREPPATGRCCYGFPAPSALQRCFLNLPTEAFDEAFSSSGLLTTEPCATVTTMPCPTPRPAVRRRGAGDGGARGRGHQAHPADNGAPPAARSLPLGLADGGHAALTRRGEPSCRKAARGADRAAAEARAASARATLRRCRSSSSPSRSRWTGPCPATRAGGPRRRSTRTGSEDARGQPLGHIACFSSCSACFSLGLRRRRPFCFFCLIFALHYGARQI